MTWHSWINAEIYDRFVRERPIYGWLNRILVELAELSRVERILDLACGTGATTLACLAEMAPRATILGIDKSAEMIGVARANVLDPRAQFEVAPAVDVGRLDERFERVVCNAAFWQFPSADPVFAALAACTRPGTRFVFNVPAARVEGESGPIHPFQVALMQEVERELGEPFLAPPTRLEPVGTISSRHGFTLVGTERHEYVGRQEELVELMTIPAMILPLTPGIDDDRRQAVVERARGKTDLAQEVTVPWIYFILERAPAQR